LELNGNLWKIYEDIWKCQQVISKIKLKNNFKMFSKEFIFVAKVVVKK
jgi:hypothetical protein